MRRAFLFSAICLFLAGSAFAQASQGSSQQSESSANPSKIEVNARRQRGDAANQLLRSNQNKQQAAKDRLDRINRERRQKARERLDRSNRENRQRSEALRRREEQKKRRKRVILWSAAAVFLVFIGGREIRNRSRRSQSGEEKED